MFEIGSVGFSFGEKPVICGGKYPNGLKNTSCHMYVRDPKFKIKPWHKWETLNTTFWLNKNRTDASVIQIDTYKALIIGGYGDSPDEEGLNSMEIFNYFGTNMSEKTLPFKFRSGCATKINSTHGMIIGGFQDNVLVPNTLFINLNTYETSPGPQFRQGRYWFGCGSTPNKVVIGGGMNENEEILDSTEILDLSTPNPTWTSGKKSNHLCFWLPLA